MFEAMKDMMDTQRKIQTKNALSLEQIYALLMQRAPIEQLGAPELKKGLLGSSINFPKVAKVTPRITVKGTEVKIGQIVDSSSTTVSVLGGPKVAVDKKGRPISFGDSMSEAKQGSQYFKAVADAVTAALADQ